MTNIKRNKTTENISISLPSWLLEIVDYHCDAHDFNRSSLIKRAVKQYISRKRSEDVSFWDAEYKRIKDE